MRERVRQTGLAIQPRGAQSVWRGKVVAHILGRQQAPGKMPGEDDPQPLTRDERDRCRFDQTLTLTHTDKGETRKEDRNSKRMMKLTVQEGSSRQKLVQIPNA